MFNKFPFHQQSEGADCAPACIKMIAQHYGRDISMAKIKQNTPMDPNGTTLKGVSIAAEYIGLRTNGVKLTYDGTEEESGLLDVPLPCIAFWEMRHYVVVYRCTKKHVWVADPEVGKKKCTKAVFEKSWLVDDRKGILLLTEPSPAFYEIEDEPVKKTSLRQLVNYTTRYKSLFGQLILGLVLMSLFSLILPFLTQMVVDQGVMKNNVDIIYLLLISQLIIFFASTFVSFIQSWIFLHIGVRINVSLVHDFLSKLMKLPIGFVNGRVIGDFLQRIEDHQRINNFITSSLINFIFSLLTILIFSVVLVIYSLQLFFIYWVSSILYVLWILAFLKPRKRLDIKTFKIESTNQSKLIEIINGLQEIRIQGSQGKRRWQWVNIQGKMFRLKLKSLLLSQFQGAGAGAINQLKNIFISFVAATSVINGEISLGMMLAVQYIIGFLNTPLESVITFAQQAQDAKLGYDRINEIHEQPNEEDEVESKSMDVPESGDIVFKNVTFAYGADQKPALKNVSLTIERHKTTAIVGKSGSGKTTILKLLLGLYSPVQGEIRIGPLPLHDIKLSAWRVKCGAVLQEGFVFPDTIAHNICESDDEVDNEKMFKAADVALLEDIIENTSNGYNTAIGEHGVTLSKGQVQRILIARAVYKNPDFIFFDEATNSLDATNEREIMENLYNYYNGKTVVVVAHRLSTIRNADKIIVIDRGQIVETGKHEDLLVKKGHYFTLVSNQLEMHL